MLSINVMALAKSIREPSINFLYNVSMETVGCFFTNFLRFVLLSPSCELCRPFITFIALSFSTSSRSELIRSLPRNLDYDKFLQYFFGRQQGSLYLDQK